MNTREKIFWYGSVISVSLFLCLAFVMFRTALAQVLWGHSVPPEIVMFLNAKDAELAKEVGDYYFNGGAYDLDKAKQAFEKARAIDPELLGTRFQLSRIEFIRGNFKPALALANEELELHPEFDRVYYLRGLIYGYAGNLSLAVVDFREFLKTHEESWAAHNDLAWIYFRQGEFEKVAETAKNALKWDPDNPWLLTTYGTALLNLGRKSEARAILAEALVRTEELTAEGWGGAYPGNNPAIYAQGWEEMKKVIKNNIELARD